jgi:hypothetical protein
LKTRFGWVDIYAGRSLEEYLKIERALCENAIKYHGFEFNYTSKVVLAFTQLTTLSKNGLLNPIGVLAGKTPPQDNDVFYTLEIKRRDLERYHSIRAGKSTR